MAFLALRQRELRGARAGPRFRLVPYEHDPRLLQLVLGDEPVWVHRESKCGLHPLCGTLFQAFPEGTGVTLHFHETLGALFPIPGLAHETPGHAMARCGGGGRRAAERGWAYAVRLAPSLSCLDEPALMARAEDALERVPVSPWGDKRLCM